MNRTLIGIAALAVLAAVILAIAPKPAVPEFPVGAVAGPAIMSPWYSVGGLIEYKASVPLTTGTTTVCALQAPAATSTLESAGVLFTVSSTSASTVTLAKASTAFATTTSLGQHVVAANAQGMIQASTTESVGLNDKTVFGPNEWFVVGMAGGTGTFSPTGNCHATFEVYPI